MFVDGLGDVQDAIIQTIIPNSASYIAKLTLQEMHQDATTAASVSQDRPQPCK